MTTLIAKRCRHCDTLTVAAEFPRNRRVSDGFSSWCRVCHSGAVKDWQRRHPEYMRRRDEARAEKARTKTAQARVLAAIGKSCPVPWTTCKECAERFPHRRGARGLFCSEICRQTATDRGYRLSRIRNPQTTWLARVKPITEKSCFSCGALFMGKPHRRFCSPEHALGHHRKVYRDRKRAGRLTTGKVGHVDRQVVFARDGWRCQLCRRAVTRNPKSRAMWPTLDHIVPLSAGGSHEYPNVQLAHMICNQRKHASGAGQLRLTL